jgi:hypothetical protein
MYEEGSRKYYINSSVDVECLVIKCTIHTCNFLVSSSQAQKSGTYHAFCKTSPPRSLEIGLFCILCTIRAIGIVEFLCVFFILLSGLGQLGVALCFTAWQSFICCDNIMPSIDNLQRAGKSILCGIKRRRRKNKILCGDKMRPGKQVMSHDVIRHCINSQARDKKLQR